MYALILFIPLFSFLSAGFLGRFIGEKGASLITVSSIVLTFMISCFGFYEIGLCGSSVYVDLWNWMDVGLFSVSFTLMFDQITCVMLIVVTGVSCLVHLYSTEYMSGDPHLCRFMSYLSLFTFFMLILVTSSNLLTLFIGWEGVGLCSYLLINFWYTRIQANKSAIKAMVVNRVGDVGLALGMFVCFDTFGSLDYSVMFTGASECVDSELVILGHSFHSLTLISLLLFIGAVGKSAQLGLHGWLPDAMEGPTPVSALIHAATMVTAGVFLLVRCSPIIEHSDYALGVIAVIGASTAFFAATVGLFQNDIKKVIAYSTCSQLGYMVFACGVSNYGVGLFHLANHAFFKALLFLSAGCVIHAMADEQDMRKLGGLIKSIPFTYSMMLIGSLSLMGFPFLTGFYSKDAILELAYSSYSIDGCFAHWLGTLSAGFTAFYSIRLLVLTFIVPSNAPQATLIGSHESPWRMWVPLWLLSFGAIFVGYLGRDAIIGGGSNFFQQSIFVLPSHNNVLEGEFMNIFVKWVPVMFSFTGAILGFILFNLPKNTFFGWMGGTLGKVIYTFFNNKWNVDFVLNHYIAKPALRFGHDVTYKVIDRGLIEAVGPVGISNGLVNLSGWLSKLQSGQIYNYAFSIFLASTLILLGNNLSLDLDLAILLPMLYYVASNKK
jgi:NADH-ubiquinone oxidoreductase chain 5